MKKQGGRGGIGTLEASCGEWTKTKRFRVFFGHFSPHCPGLLVLFFGKPIQSACSCYCAGSNSLNKLFLTVVAPHGYRSSTLVQGPQYGALRVALNTRAKRLNIFGEGFFLITVLGKCGLRIWQNNSNECKRSENQTGFCSFTCFFFFKIAHLSMWIHWVKATRCRWLWSTGSYAVLQWWRAAVVDFFIPVMKSLCFLCLICVSFSCRPWLMQMFLGVSAS